MQMNFELNSPSRPPSLLRKLVGLVVTVAVVALALMFSAMLLVVIAIIGTIAGIYLWWKTRELRKHMREISRQRMAQEAQASNDEVFEGEVIRVVEPRDEK
jgi:HAMP domain-containing protein